MFLRFALALAAAVLVTAPRALAYDPDDEVVSVKVKTGDLDLNSHDGARVLLRRMNHAAELICGEPDPHDLARMRLYRTCMSQTLEPVVASLGNPRVSTLYAKDHRTQTALAVNR